MLGRKKDAPPSGTQALLQHKLVQSAFKDPRYRHLNGFANYDDSEPEQVNYDRAMTMQALAAVYTIQSAEKQARAILIATWGLVFTTVGLVAATVVLVVVTARL